MSAIVWADHTHAEVFAALERMPRVAGAWYDDDANRSASRADPQGACLATTYPILGRSEYIWYTYYPTRRDEALTLAEAKAACDAALVAAGWLLADALPEVTASNPVADLARITRRFRAVTARGMSPHELAKLDAAIEAVGK